MHITVTAEQIIDLGLTRHKAQALLDKLTAPELIPYSAEETWQIISQSFLVDYPFPIHLFLFTLLFPTWRQQPDSAPAWLPTNNSIMSTNIHQFITMLNHPDIKAFHQWTVTNFTEFWGEMLKKLHIVFQVPPYQIVDMKQGIEALLWLPGAKLNIINSCFTADPASTAIIYENADKSICHLSYAELNHSSQQIANSLIAQGFSVNNAIGICMPMNAHAIAIYLGIIKIGGIVISIADSFSSQEISLRLTIAKAKGIFTQDKVVWGDNLLPLYEKVKTATTQKIIVLPYHGNNVCLPLRTQDCAWSDFLIESPDMVTAIRDPMDTCNILFSSGTTAEPKAIPWNHTTPIKVASDAYFHQNIQPGDILAWPTNLGWMMGPWVIFAALINRATIAIYAGSAKEKAFGEFIARANVNILGVVPTLVAYWRQTKCMEGLDWQHIKLFTSTGECSNPEDMLYLMSLAGYKPIIEYCGGTEIGGAYLTSTIIEKNYPSLFSTKAMGIDFMLIDEHGKEADVGEVAILPPSIGLSTQLLNANHHDVYFTNMPISTRKYPLRRHGDQIKQLPNHYFCILGRTDDSMNLGGIKISAAEIERVIAGIPMITETAAIAITPNNHGPSQLIIYAATRAVPDKKNIMQEMQMRINKQLNPLFKIREVIFINELPKTASNKIMRRRLREMYTYDR